MLLSNDENSEDPITPDSIVHGVDCMLCEDGEGFEFYYNYLIYTFRRDGEEIIAKHYMDSPGVVSLAVSLDGELSDFKRDILVYLCMRYNQIEHYAAEGYVQIPESHAADVRSEVVKLLKVTER